MKTAIHVTHEAIKKFGGIGTVLNGLITCKEYHKYYDKTLLYTPLFHFQGDIVQRLGENSEVLYSGIDGVDESNYKKIFSPIEEKYGIDIVYGKKLFLDECVDIVAVNIWKMNRQLIDGFKYNLWKYYGIQSEHFQNDSDYEQYLRIALPAIDIYEALYGVKSEAHVFSHEYMGVCTALRFNMLKEEGMRLGDKTIFYAHEVSTARTVVENHPGHDVMFYNIMRMDLNSKISLEEEFGSFAHYSRNELVKRVYNFDYVFAVSDITKKELVYLNDSSKNKIEVVFNGIEVKDADFSEKVYHTNLVKDYCDILYGFAPDYIFTHVTRLVTSKALWRDIHLLYRIDEYLTKTGKKGFYVLLSTLIGDGRDGALAEKMESNYGWPVRHKEGWPDLVGAETDIYKFLEIFNGKSRSLKGVFLNQFGFEHGRCGKRVPKGASVESLRYASDAELGLSIYEPYGIAQLEAFPYGSIPVISDACGCLRAVEAASISGNFVNIEFTKVPSSFKDSLRSKGDYLRMNIALRDKIEKIVCKRGVEALIEKLCKEERDHKKSFKRAQKESRALEWKNTVKRIIKILG